MSTLAYASLTRARQQSLPGTSTTSSPPGLRTYIDALAALMPSEVLTLHAVFVTAATEVRGNSTVITAPDALRLAFWGLVIVAGGLYATSRLLTGKWDKLDKYRVFIPPAAFVGWTMLQRSTAFDVICPELSGPMRTILAVFVAVALGMAASVLAYKADQSAVQ